MPPTRPFDLCFFTRRLRRLSVVTAILAVLIPERLSGEERGRYWSRYNDALFYTISF